MSGFSLDWLNLREPIDAASRADDLSKSIAATIHRGRPPGDRTLVVDLGAGTGANLRYLAPFLGGTQEWLLVDGDAALLNAVTSGAWASSGSGYECQTHTMLCDLANEMDRLVLPSGGLVTASALLDLVSSDWLESLAERCAKVDAPVLFALTYDGRIECHPRDPMDDEIRQLVNAHQRTDKGFGPALGPHAGRSARRIFEGHGYKVETATSDWRIQKSQQALQLALLEGWFGAAAEVDPGGKAWMQSWLGRRLALVASGQSELVVGHSDMIGAPRTRGAG